MEKSDIQGMTAPRPVKMLHTSTTGSDRKILTGGTIKPACKEVI